jgi:hypothetical protein
MQMQYLRAVGTFWADPRNNPVSNIYAGPMVDMDHAHVWAWDARPFPAFPARSEVWGDSASTPAGTG